MQVKTILDQKGSDVIWVSPWSSVAETAETLTEHGIGAVVVRDADGTLRGVLSERDIVRGLANNGSSCMNWPVERLMTREVIICALEDSIDSVMTQMTEHRVRHLPVMDGKRLAGLVSIGDVVKQRIQQVEREAQEMRDYIAAA